MSDSTTTGSALLGSWYAANPGGGTDQIVFTFLANGTFLIADKGTTARDPSGQSGLEWGSYTWDASTGAYSATYTINTDGQWGLSNSGVRSMQVYGDTLVMSDTTTATRTPVSATSIVGSWYAANPGGGTDQVVFTFLADGTFLVADKGTPARDPSGTSGIEWGNYTWNATTGALSYTATVNTDLQWGLSNSGFSRAQVVGDTLVLGNMVVSRVPVAAASAAAASTSVGTTAGDRLTGTALADTLIGRGGNDTIDGGAGIDTAVYASTRSNYTVARSGTSFTVLDKTGSEGTDTLTNVERLRFSDQGLALDMGATQSAGATMLLLGAVLGRAPVLDKTLLVGNVISLFDQGYTLNELSGAVMRLDIWGILANGGKAGATNQQIANYLLTTVNGSAPDAATLASATTAIGAGVQGDFLAQLALSSANQTQVGLVGLAATGLSFTLV